MAVGLTGAFEILSIDTAQKRIGVALVDEGSAFAASPLQGDRSSRAAAAASTEDANVPDAAPEASMGSMADKLRGALKGR